MKVYLITRDFLDEVNGSSITTTVFSDENKAREVFENEVNRLMCDYCDVIDVCDSTPNSAEFYNEGRYLEWHDCLRFEEKDIEE